MCVCERVREGVCVGNLLHTLLNLVLFLKKANKGGHRPLPSQGKHTLQQIIKIVSNLKVYQQKF